MARLSISVSLPGSLISTVKHGSAFKIFLSHLCTVPSTQYRFSAEMYLVYKSLGGDTFCPVMEVLQREATPSKS